MIFRHGERTPDRIHMYKNDPYLTEEFLPYGPGQLTNIGKRSMYELGTAIKNKYADLLGDFYKPQYVDAITSAYDRSKTSLQLVLASLFPPTGENKWHETLNWQPIPYKFSDLKTDKFLGMVMENEKFIDLYKKNFQKEEGQKLLLKYNELVNYLRQHTGEKIETTREAWSLLGVLITENEFGLQLPDWTRSIYPYKLAEFAMLEYQMQTATNELRQIVVGKLMKKILEDTKSKIIGESDCKIHLYSGHDYNISVTLIFFGLMYPHFPRYAACLLLEVHKIKGKYGMKISYRSNKTTDFKYLTFQSGSDFLDLNDFEKLVEDTFNDNTQSQRTIMTSNI